MKSRKSISMAIVIVSSLLIVLGFQNCGAGFKPAGSENLDYSSNLGKGEIFTCDPSQNPTPIGTRRLTKVEVSRTISQLLRTLPTAEQTAINTALTPFLSSIPDDLGSKFDSDDILLSQSHVSAYFALAKALAEQLTTKDVRIKAFAGTCATTIDLSPTCLTQFLSGPATRIFRRPLNAAEIASFKAGYGAVSDKKPQWLLVRLLLSPSFLYHLELEGTTLKPTILKISPYELASRISFHLLKSSPDDQLLAAAADGSIMSSGKIRSEIDRLVQAYPSYMADSVDRFYEGWLSYQHIANPLDPQTPEELAFAAGDTVSRQSLINEIQAMTRHYTFNSDGSFDDLLLSKTSFAVDRDLANLYGVPQWTGNTNQLVSFVGSERAGLLNRAAFLVSGSTHTSPITRGLSVRREFLCDELPPPPTDIANMVRDPDDDPNASTRERFHAKTSSAACAGCHTQINPLGFALESYDAFGRFRTIEKIFDDKGVLINQLKIDPVVQPLISINDTRTSKNAADFNSLIADSGKARACMVKSFFQYASRVEPNNIKDGCALTNLDKIVSQPGGLKNLLLYAPQSSFFSQRVLD